jgi:hypothetical protein
MAGKRKATDPHKATHKRRKAEPVVDHDVDNPKVAPKKKEAVAKPSKSEGKAKADPQDVVPDDASDSAVDADVTVVTRDEVDNSMSESEDGEADDADAVPGPARRKSKAKKPSQPRKPVKELFTPWTPDFKYPPKNPAWGTIPYPVNWDIEKAGRDDPYIEPVFTTGGPPARSTNAQTVPPLWEDRKWEFREGRYHKAWRAKQADEVDDPTLPDLDQEDNLVLKLIDMRPTSKRNPTPKREPTFYVYAAGKPKDWHNRQTLKALNDRRREAIWRITRDTPWSQLEREFLTELCTEFPDASILELAQRFNHRFVGDFKESDAMRFHHLHTGRTLESVRSEYITYKEWYTADPPVTPNPVRQEGDKTDLVKKGNKRVETLGDQVMAKFMLNSEKITFSEYEELVSELTEAEIIDLDEQLADLAGWNDPDEVRSSAADSSRQSHETSAEASSVKSATEDAVDSPARSPTQSPAPSAIENAASSTDKAHGPAEDPVDTIRETSVETVAQGSTAQDTQHLEVAESGESESLGKENSNAGELPSPPTPSVTELAPLAPAGQKRARSEVDEDEEESRSAKRVKGETSSKEPRKVATAKKRAGGGRSVSPTSSVYKLRSNCF